MAQKNHVFISYRRDGGDSFAMLLYTLLKMDGYHPFLDIETMRSGKFNEQIYDKIAECDDFVCILPPHGLDRCVNEDDWVRLEIARAIKLKKNIVPILMRGFEFPASLPEDISDLQWFNGVGASHEYFDASYDKLKNHLMTKPVAEDGQTPAPKAKDELLSVLVSAYEAITAYLDGMNHGDQKKIDACAVDMMTYFRQLHEYSELQQKSAPDRAMTASKIIQCFNKFISVQARFFEVRDTNQREAQLAFDMMNLKYRALEDALVDAINQVQASLGYSADFMPDLDVLLLDAYRAVNSYMNALADGDQQAYDQSEKPLMNAALAIEKYRKLKSKIDPLGAEMAASIVAAYNEHAKSLAACNAARRIDPHSSDCNAKEAQVIDTIRALKQAVLSAIHTR